MNNDTQPSKDDLKMRSTTIQRLANLFDSLVVEPQSGLRAIKTAGFEYPEIDPFRVIVPLK